MPLARIAIRQYDELGIDPRLEGWLLYTEDSVDRLRLLKPMRPLRFSLEEMKDCLRLRDRLAAGVTDVAQRERMFHRLDSHAREADLRAGPWPHEIAMAREFSAQVRQLADRFRTLTSSNPQEASSDR